MEELAFFLLSAPVSCYNMISLVHRRSARDATSPPPLPRSLFLSLSLSAQDYICVIDMSFAPCVVSGAPLRVLKKRFIFSVGLHFVPRGCAGRENIVEKVERLACSQFLATLAGWYPRA